MNSSTWPSPAKLNLFLHINGKRPDGYHQLQSIFAILDFGDEITFTKTNDENINVTVSPSVDFLMTDNLVYKAVLALREATNTHYGINIHITKRIPMGGGLGGGSSNAATTLVALNEIWQTYLSVDELARIGRKLGADVPVFVRGQSAFAEGVGEILTPYHIEEKFYLVATPVDTHVSTKEIFSHPDLPRNTPKLDMANIDLNNTKNDCENLVKNNYPSVAKCLDCLIKYAPSRMTGTGASCFASFNSLMNAQKVQKELPKCYNSFVAQAKNTSPLYEALLAYRNKQHI